ncbi:DUF4157 domain-containing protein [Fulvivirga sp. M361]|uniref:eCIS core domain-containing protein n=1 Tax=Fulvivirga sp. M361 TaxID=2594266 RepID=UPI00117BCBFD|nr:DUF4157 domain-containing protein [Fulvivirga sp. M361]TRX47254.1 DUF4157 domain-containing protein [Fulvivirga sp. M361]
MIRDTRNNISIHKKDIKSSECSEALPESLRKALEYLSDLDLSEVRVYYNSLKPADVNAWAYACDGIIYLSAGKEHLLPHESWHIVQQWQGRVTPTNTVNGVYINDEQELEKEADIMGDLALKMASALNEGYIRFFDSTHSKPLPEPA